MSAPDHTAANAAAYADFGVAADSAGSSIAPAFEGELARLRRASGDVHLRSYRLTPERLAAYLAGVRAMMRGGPQIDDEDPGAALDPDRQPALRPWESGAAPAVQPDPVATVATAITRRPALAAAIRSAVPVGEFAAAHLKLTVCARAMLLLAGEEAGTLTVAAVERWVAAHAPRSEAEADLAASLVTAVAGRADIDAAFEGR